MDKKITEKLIELGFRQEASYHGIARFDYGSDSVEQYRDNTWCYVEYMGYNENTMMGMYDSHSFSTVDELMELVKKFHPNLIKD